MNKLMHVIHMHVYARTLICRKKYFDIVYIKLQIKSQVTRPDTIFPFERGQQ